KAHPAKAFLIATNPRLAFARAAGLLRSDRHSVEIHPSAVIDAKAKLGNGVSIGANAVIGRSTIGERANIGAGCVIGDGVEIGKGCEIYPNVTVYPGSRLGDRVIVHAGAILGSDGFGYV